MNDNVESKESKSEASNFNLKMVKPSKKLRKRNVELFKKLLILVFFIGLLSASVYLHESQIGRRQNLANSTSFLTNYTADNQDLSNNISIIYAKASKTVYNIRTNLFENIINNYYFDKS